MSLAKVTPILMSLQLCIPLRSFVLPAKISGNEEIEQFIANLKKSAKVIF